MNESPKPDSSPEEPDEPARTFRSEDLLQGRREIHIEHRGEVYRLLQTRNGKLLLQK